MAIVQISQITNRKGLQVDLPQLAGAEFGWSTDTRQLWIGNGSLQDGAPVIGNTEILTEFSDILAVATAYTYQGADAGYNVQTGPTAGTPVKQSLQTWLDQFATVKDFGAVGDGITDDTDAINRALYQLYCREVNPQIRRSLFFPGGVYRVTSTINIPTFATLYGEGIDSSVILMDNTDDSTLNTFVARTADSLQQTGVDIGTNGAIAPQSITISNMGFHSLNVTPSIFMVEDTSTLSFLNVGFVGALTTAELNTDAPSTAAVTFASTPSLITNEITFDGCLFSGTVWGVYGNDQIEGITVINSKFDTLYQGVALGTGYPIINGGPTGVRIVSNIFDNIYAEGIVFGAVSINASGSNIFYDVGNYFQGISNPNTVIIDIQTNNNVSISDLFARTDDFAVAYPRIRLNGTASIATTNGEELAMGTYVRQSGYTFPLPNNSSGTVTTVSALDFKAFSINYTITRDVNYRTGVIVVATSSGSGDLTYTEDFVENTGHYQGISTLGSPGVGVALSVSQTGTNVSFNFVTSNTGLPGSLTYSISHLA